MITQKTYLVGLHPSAFRRGEVSEIKTLKFAKPEKLNWRLVYEIEFLSDGFIDHVALQDIDAGNYAIISDTDLALGRIPKY